MLKSDVDSEENLSRLNLNLTMFLDHFPSILTEENIVPRATALHFGSGSVDDCKTDQKTWATNDTYHDMKRNEEHKLN